MLLHAMLCLICRARPGIATPESIGLLHESDPAQWTAHYEVNVVGPVVLYKAFRPLLQASAVAAKFVIISSALGSLTLSLQFNTPAVVYGTSKAAANYATVKIHLESEDFGLIAFPLHPGYVATDMNPMATKDLSGDGEKSPYAHLAISPEQSAEAVLKVVSEATRESHGGKLLNYDGSVLPY
ncbi:Predicted short chain-type dehydrogenase [Phaffia rhodozyma]|uniref:Predicted short chain-type dehydrogenase n=1 Tax=Phaffia rhodozyma TaxID=264483 RepID=A0A0F7SGN7_PHARH|nr:Predicted short chain-type dehydrogenase [Phaffia rhodozyma]